MASNLISYEKVFNPSGMFEEDKEEEDLVDDELVQSEAAAKQGCLQIALHVLKTMKMDPYVFILEQSKRLHHVLGSVCNVCVFVCKVTK